MKDVEPDVKVIFEKKIAESEEFEERMRHEDAVVAELEKVEKILKEINEELKNKESKLFTHLYSGSLELQRSILKQLKIKACVIFK